MPPPGGVGLDGEVHQRRRLVLVHAVQLEQVGDVTLLEADPAQFHPADLGTGRADGVSGLFAGDPSHLAQHAQLGAQEDTQNGRAAP